MRTKPRHGVSPKKNVGYGDTPEFIEILDTIAESEGLSRSFLIGKILREYIKNNY